MSISIGYELRAPIIFLHLLLNIPALMRALATVSRTLSSVEFLNKCNSHTLFIHSISFMPDIILEDFLEQTFLFIYQSPQVAFANVLNDAIILNIEKKFKTCLIFHGTDQERKVEFNFLFVLSLLAATKTLFKRKEKST